MNTHEGIEIMLAGRHAMYNAFHVCIAEEPTVEVLALLEHDALQEVFDMYSSQSQQLEVKYTSIQKALAKLPRDKAEASEHLLKIYYSLFMGPGRMDAPPWETLYVSKDQALFQQTTLGLRKEYVKHGFIPQSYPHVADDHLGLELHYVTLLAQRMIEAYASHDTQSLVSNIKASCDFLENHLERWLPQFLQALCNAPNALLYEEYSDYVIDFISYDKTILVELEKNSAVLEAVK